MADEVKDDIRDEYWSLMTMGMAGLSKPTCEVEAEEAEDGSLRGTFVFDGSKEWSAAKLVMYLVGNSHGKPVTISKGNQPDSLYRVSFTFPPYFGEQFRHHAV